MLQMIISFMFLIFSHAAAAEAIEHALPKSPNELQATLVAPDVYVIHGLQGGPNPRNLGWITNVGVVVSDEGLLMIDTGISKRHAERLITEIEKISDLPVIAVFNTHVHGDHWLGNQQIAERYPEAVFYAHENLVNKRSSGVGESWLSLLSEMTDGALDETVVHYPDSIVSPDQPLVFGDANVNFLSNSQAHTDSDIVLQIQQAAGHSVVFLGDTAVFHQLGRMDDGSFRGNIEILQSAVALEADVYVPGHGPATAGSHAAEGYLDYLSLLYQLVEIEYEEGLMDFQIKEKIRPQFERWHNWGGFEEVFGRHVSLLYLEIEDASF